MRLGIWINNLDENEDESDSERESLAGYNNEPMLIIWNITAAPLGSKVPIIQLRRRTMKIQRYKSKRIRSLSWLTNGGKLRIPVQDSWAADVTSKKGGDSDQTAPPCTMFSSSYATKNYTDKQERNQKGQTHTMPKARETTEEFVAGNKWKKFLN